MDSRSNIRLIADDNSLYMVVDNCDTLAEVLNWDINKMITKKWSVSFNLVKHTDSSSSRYGESARHRN